MRIDRKLLLVSLCAVLLGMPAQAQTSLRKIGEMDLTLLGLTATVDNPAPVVPKNTPSGIRVIFKAGTTQLSDADVARFLGGSFQVQAELSGPGIQTVTLPLADAPQVSSPTILPIPEIPTSGDYTLSNLRIVVNNSAVLDVFPQNVPLKVIEQVLVTSITTTPLTLDEIKAKGIVLDSNSYIGFQFTLGLALQSQQVTLSFPVVFDRQGVPIPQPILPPATPSVTGVALPPLPSIYPLLLTIGDGGGGSKPPQFDDGNGHMVPIQIPSVLVIPGNVGYLKQFFSAKLYVADGAPVGSSLAVQDVTGTINLPPGADGVPNTSDDPLSLPATKDGPQNFTKPVLGLGSDGQPSVPILNPGDQGQQEWILRGEKEGYSPISFNIAATLNGLVTGPVKITGIAKGGVLVRNPFFDVTFTVPATVRKAEPFKLFLTLTNIGKGTGNNVNVTLDAAQMSGAHLAPGANQTQTIPTILPSDAKTLEFDFVSDSTGQVIASYLHFDTGDGSTGEVRFTLGVGERGIPLSPDTLSLPTAVDNLPQSVVDAAMRVLGQAWSIANAPAGALPQGVIRTDRNAVTQKALALAEAGLRVGLGQPLNSALRDLGLDFYGGSPVDPGFDQLMRTTNAGHDFAAALGAALAQPASDSGGPLAYERQIAQLAASGPDFISFAVTNGSSAAPVDVVLSDNNGNVADFNAQPPRADVLSAVMVPLGNSHVSPVLGLITNPTASPYSLVLNGSAAGSVDVSVTLPRGDGTFVRGQITGVPVTAGGRSSLTLDLSQPSNLVLKEDTKGTGIYDVQQNLTEETLSPQGPQFVSANMIGPETLAGATPFGFQAALLFDRPVSSDSAADATHYQVPSNAIQAAKSYLSGRLVIVNLQQPEGRFVPTSVNVSGVTDFRGVSGPRGTQPIGSKITDTGAVVSGQILNADGTPNSSAVITYENNGDFTCKEPAVVGMASLPVGADGRFQFRYVRQDNCGGPFTLATTDPNTGALRQVTGNVRADGQQIVLNIQLFGRGSVGGTVTDLTKAVVPGAQVTVISQTDPQIGATTTTDGNGEYLVSGITVGPVSVTAANSTSLGTSAGNIQRAGTTAIVNVVLDGGSVSATGTVSKLENGVSTVIPGLPVVYYQNSNPFNPIAVGVTTTGADGTYSLTGMPTGAYKIVAALNVRDQAAIGGTATGGDHLTNQDLVITIQAPSTYGTAQGIVRFPDGSPAGGVIVSIDQSGLLSNADGTFTLPGIAVKPNISQTIFALTRDGLRSGSVPVVINTSGQVVPGIVITLSGIGSAEYTVLDPAGNPVRGASVGLLDGSCFDECGCNKKNTDTNGKVHFDNLGLGSISARAVAAGSGFTDVATGSASILSDGSTGFGILRFNGAGAVTGGVIDPDSKPVFGAQVALSSNAFDPGSCSLRSMNSQTVGTDQNGQFHFTGVNVGPVGVSVSQIFFPTPVAKQGTITHAGQSVDFQLQLVNTIAGVLSGTVFLPDGVTPAGSGVAVTANGPLPDVTVNTDMQGHFAFARIFPQGSYTLTTSDPITGDVSRDRVFLQAGQDLAQNLRLKGKGKVVVTVVDGSDQPVSNASVKLQETEFPSNSYEGTIQPANQGIAEFDNVFQGPISVQASDALGRGGRISAVLPNAGDTIQVKVQLSSTGSVKGHFFMPDHTTPIAYGIVQLTASGRVIGQTSTLGIGDVGSFAFDFVPVGPVQLNAQDPATARTGIAAGTINSDQQVVTLDVTAEALGMVQGVVTQNQLPEPGATVEIFSGTYHAKTVADAAGHYMIDGVPGGHVVANASFDNGFLSGAADGNLAGEGSILNLDIAMRSAGKLIGQVLQADNLTPAGPAFVTVQVGGTGGGSQTVTTDSQGNFTFDVVPAGDATLSAQLLGTIDLGDTTAPVLENQTTTANISLNGIGSITGHALDSNRQPVAGTVNVYGTGKFTYYFSLTVGSDGNFTLPQVLAGPFTASLTVPGQIDLHGTTTGRVQPKLNTDINVQVQPSGTVKGTVFRPDGVTFAVGANVSIQIAGVVGSINLQVQSDGTFTAVGVPVGALTININDPLTNGVGVVHNDTGITTGQVLDVGPVTLDNTSIALVSITPPDGTVNMAYTQPITITFNEALGSANGINLQVVNGGFIGFNSLLSADRKTVTLNGTWPDSALVAVNITTGVQDIFGRNLVQPVTTHFQVIDLTPPFVTGIIPAPGAIQVAPGSSIVLTFNEALSANTDLTSVVQLTANGANVPGTSFLTSPNVVTFTPSSPLPLNTIFNVSENGEQDLSGNVQTIAYTSTFASVDTIPPVLQFNAPGAGAVVNVANPVIAFSAIDTLSGVDYATATVVLDNQTVVTGQLSFQATNLSDGVHTVAASVADRAGNVGTLSGQKFTVDVTPPTPAQISGVTEGQIIQGSVALSATASDLTSGVASIALLMDGHVVTTFSGANFTLNLDTNILPDGAHTLTAQATDVAGNVGAPGAAIDVIVNNHPLVVTINSPANGAFFRDSVLVQATVSQPVLRVDFTIGTQTVSVSSAPYQATLSLASLADGPQVITVTGFAAGAKTGSATVTINVKTKPPAAPNAALINAEPPKSGISLVHASSGAVDANTTVEIKNTVNGAFATTLAAGDGSFATNIPGSVDDRLQLDAVDIVGNRGPVTTIAIRQTPSIPPSSGATSLVYQGNLVDRIGGGASGLSPDGQLDAVFTLSLSVGQGVTRQISYIDLAGPVTRSTRFGGGTGVLGVAVDVGSPLLNGSDGNVNFPVSGSAALTLFAVDGGFVQPGATYTVTAVFTDGSQFVATFTIVPPADRTQVAHSATFTTNPTTVIVNGATPGTTVITLTAIRDINGTLVPDGAKVALSATDMASKDPLGNAIRSAGGVFTDGVAAANNAAFKVYTIFNGTVTATYSSDTVSPAPVYGALAVVQLQSADAAGNVLGMQAVGTTDINIRAASDQAIVMSSPDSLYVDGGDHRSHFTIQLHDASGNPLPDGSKVVVQADNCATLNPFGGCNTYAGGLILGGTPNGSNQPVFTVIGGAVSGDYSDAGLIGTTGGIYFAGIQVVPADVNGNATTRSALGIGTITLVGAGASELQVAPDSVPYVFPLPQLVQVVAHHLHDMRANLVPDGANILLTATNCFSLNNFGGCNSSAGGTMGGNSGTNSSGLGIYPLVNGEALATYSTENVSAPGAGQVVVANVQLLMESSAGNPVDRRAVAITPIQVLGPLNAVGSSQPASIFADGGIHTSAVTFSPILDAFGNPLPDGSTIIASASSCAALTSFGGCFPSAGGQIIEGTSSPSSSIYKVLSVQNGAVSLTYADQGIASVLGQIQVANVVLMEAGPSGSVQSRSVLGVVPISLAGLTSAQGSASPTVLHADGGDYRSTITISKLVDASGHPVPDGSQIALTASSCGALTQFGGCIFSAGGEILGGTPLNGNPNFRVFAVANGQVVTQYSSQGVSVNQGQNTATIQIVSTTPDGNMISRTAIGTVSVQLLAPSSATVAVNPGDLFSDGGSHLAQVTISGLLDSDGVTPVPDGAKVGLTAGNCVTLTAFGGCVFSAGGQILPAGTSPGDGTPLSGNSSLLMFTVVGGQVHAAYSDQGVASGWNQTQTATIAVVPLDNTGTVMLSRTAIGTGTVNLHGGTSATGSGPTTLSVSGGGSGIVTFSGIKDSAGNTVPDGTVILATVGNCVTLTAFGGCNFSSGGAIVDGTPSTWSSSYKQFTVTNGSITLTYSAVGASAPGTATVQLLPAQPDGTGLGRTSMGVWAISTTP
ncbi:MAG TPA: carboxypeptidase regulatory-like domain-containing protein [Terriglobales bacterium]|nr:carboxypeptidase regulatory-like domain-containing protein [Terriglobales bacterium]